MILSALLTSVGINLGLCFLFFTLYSILRKQPGNVAVYAPRLVSKGKSPRFYFNLESLIPSTGWVRTAWETSEDELLMTSGLDAVVFMRIFIFSLKIFTFSVLVGIFVLLPINFMGSQLSIDFSDLSHKSLESFSVSNVNDGSARLWIHFCAAYIFTGVVCYLLYVEYDYVSAKRIAYFYASNRQPHQFSILVSGIPVPSGSNFSESVESFFINHYPSTYLSHTVIRRTSKVQGLIRDAEALYRKLIHFKLEVHPQNRLKRDGILGLFGRRVDAVNLYEKKLEKLEDNVRIEQSLLAGEEVSAAFVCFKTRFAAAIASHFRQGDDPTEWITEQAPEPQDVHWPFFSASFMRRWILRLVVLVACTILIILFLIPVVLVQGLTHLDQLEFWFPFLKGILNLAIVSQVITGYLPSLILQLFLSFIPPIMLTLSSMQGHIALSRMEKSACTKVLWFTIWNIFFANVLSGSALYQVNVFLEPKKIPRTLAEGVPAQASFFIAYVVTSGWTSLSSELFRLMPLIYSYIKRTFSGISDEVEVPVIHYHSEIPKILFFGLLGVTYFFLAPLILPFLLVYYCLGYIIYRNQLLNVYAPKFESGGNFWPIVHNATIVSLLLMHIIAIGIFGLKNLPLASSLTIPLPVFTLLFNEYCRKRFLPIFRAYSAECLMKKDKEDECDPSMGQFLDKLATAYQDPALKPIQYSDSASRLHDPLLHGAET